MAPARISILLATALSVASLFGVSALQPIGPARAEAPSLPASPVTINPILQVDDDYIRLGDLFTPVDSYADRIVLRAPAPGEEMTITAIWLWKAAKTFGIDWRPVSDADTITVARPASILSPDLLEALIRDAYFSRTGDDELVEIDPDGMMARINLPRSVPPTARIERFDLDSRSGRYTATIIAPAEGRTHHRGTLSGRIHRLVELPVASRRLGKGHVIDSADIEIARMRDSRLPDNLIVDPDQLIGLAVHRSLSPGKPIRIGMVRPPILVSKDRTVLVTLASDHMTLTVQGRALEDGALGDMVRVQNTASRMIIEAEVTGEGNVVVALPINMAMSMN